MGHKKREAKGVATACATNPRTAGSATLKELNERINRGNELDKFLITVETDYKSGQEHSDTDIKDVEEVAAELDTVKKSISKLITALNPLLRL